MNKTFNIAGACIPSKHYMVDISERLAVIRRMVDRGNYFCINRGRQYGKTTTLSLLRRQLEDDYSVFFLSFEGLGEASFETDERLAATFFWMLCNKAEMGLVKGLSEEALNLLSNNKPDIDGSLSLLQLQSLIGKLCLCNQKSIVLLIDEVDQASNFNSFINFLGVLRTLFLNREDVPTFQSVILAGVYDSPWNIAVPFLEDMSLPKEGIASMLQQYASDHGITLACDALAQMLADYTGGYPYMVSRLCIIMEEETSWTHEGFLSATKILCAENNTLFDDTLKKLDDFPAMREMLYHTLFSGEEIPYIRANKMQELAKMFDLVQEREGKLVIANRIYEIWLYNKFIADERMSEAIYNSGVKDKPQFVQGDRLNMPLILERFCHTYPELYRNRTEKFDEDEGRKKFIFFMKPIINGTGNYYVEARTRGIRRSDLVIDYLGHQYIIEMKIWHGNAYLEKGEIQLEDYLRANDKAEGYMLTFNFNKQKDTPMVTTHQAEGRQILEYFV